jgi:hypothetical protein
VKITSYLNNAVASLQIDPHIKIIFSNHKNMLGLFVALDAASISFMSSFLND